MTAGEVALVHDRDGHLLPEGRGSRREEAMGLLVRTRK